MMQLEERSCRISFPSYLKRCNLKLYSKTLPQQEEQE